jgi:uncharacterized protein YvpB
MYKKYFVSQNEQNFYPEYSCGIACLLMLLKYHNIDSVDDFKVLANELNFDTAPEDKGYDSDDVKYGTFPEDIFKYLIKNNLNFRMSFYDDEWKQALKKSPIMVMMTGNEEEFGLGNSHWILLANRDKDFFTYLDPYEKSTSNNYVKYIWAGDFKRYYTGIACQLIV